MPSINLKSLKKIDWNMLAKLLIKKDEEENKIILERKKRRYASLNA